MPRDEVEVNIYTAPVDTVAREEIAQLQRLLSHLMIRLLDTNALTRAEWIDVFQAALRHAEREHGIDSPAYVIASRDLSDAQNLPSQVGRRT